MSTTTEAPQRPRRRRHAEEVLRGAGKGVAPALPPRSGAAEAVGEDALGGGPIEGWRELALQVLLLAFRDATSPWWRTWAPERLRAWLLDEGSSAALWLALADCEGLRRRFADDAQWAVLLRRGVRRVAHKGSGQPAGSRRTSVGGPTETSA